MNKRKTVKFWDHENTRNQRIRSPAVGDAKTSEYKSFQKLFGKFHSNQPPTHDNDSSKFDANDSMLKRNNPAATKFHGKRSISPALVVTPIAQRPFSSTNTILQKSDQNGNARCKQTMSNIQSSREKGEFDPWGSSLSPGPENKYAEIFSSKRGNLLKVAARTLTCKADDIISIKSKLIQECLQRLSTGQKSANPDEISKSRKKTSRARYPSQASMRSHNKDNEMQDLQGRRDTYSTMRRKDDPSLLDHCCYRADDQFAPIFPNLQFISYSNAEKELEFHTRFNSMGHIPLKVPTIQSIEWYSDSMLDEEEHYKSSSNRNSHNFPYRRELEQQQIVPYSNSNISYNFCDKDTYPKEKYYDFPLLEHQDTSTRPEYSEELDSLPRTLYNEHTTLDQIETENIEEINFFGKKDTFRYSPIGDYSKYQFDDELSWCTTKNNYGDCVNKNDLMEMERPLPSDFSSSYNFDMDSEAGFFDFCPAPETSFFDFLSVPERFSWHDL